MKRNLLISAVLAAVLGVAAYANVCSGNRPLWCRVRYKPAGNNTQVLLDCRCTSSRETWYVSFFEGDQPELWDWYEIQNTASELIR